MMLPKQIANEKNTWDTAAYHTCTTIQLNFNILFGQSTDPRINQFIPLWFKKINDTVDSAWQRNRSNEQHSHDDIWKNCQKIWRFPRAFDTLNHNQGDKNPSQQ